MTTDRQIREAIIEVARAGLAFHEAWVTRGAFVTPREQDAARALVAARDRLFDLWWDSTADPPG